MKNKNYKAVLILVLFLAAVLRFYKLGEMPPGITNDEAGYIYSAYSIFKTGTDPTGKFLPLSINLDNSFSPVYIYGAAPFVGLLGLSPFAGRLPFALTSIGSVALLFFLVKKLFGHDSVALLSALILAISPWSIHIGRAAFDANFALFFYLLGIYLFIVNIEKRKIVFSLPAFLLAFYSYHATKIFFIFLIPVLIYIYWSELIAHKKSLTLFIIGCGLILLSFAYLMRSQQASSRLSIFLFNQTEIKKAAQTVDWEREKNTTPFFLRPVFNNKLLYFLRVMRENYLEALSPNFLFLYGDTYGVPYVSPFYRGQMYIIELPLLILGIIFIFKARDKRLKKLWLLLLLIAPLPSAFNSDKTYIFRSIMMLPLLSIGVAAGIYYFWFNLRKNNFLSWRFLGFLFLAAYLFLFASYLNQYFYRYSIYGAEGWFRSSRDLAEYLKDNSNRYQNIYISGAGPMFIFQYAIFNKIEPTIVQDAWKSPYPQKLDKITLLAKCLDEEASDPRDSFLPETLYIAPENCHKDFPSNEEIRDFGEPLRVVWKIYKKN